MRLRTLSMIIVLLGITARGYCYQAEVVDVSGTKYFPAAMEALGRAQKSINLVMFVIELSPYKENLKADQFGHICYLGLTNNIKMLFLYHELPKITQFR